MKRRVKRSMSIGAALLAFAAACPTSAQLPDFEERRREALDTLVGELEVYAEWCRGKRLFLVRQGVLERLLVLEPDHAVAHRALGHRKDRDGRWVPPAKPKQFRDFDQRALAQASERYEAALEPFDALVRPMLRDERLAPDQRLVLAADVLFIDPDDPELRSQRGEVKVDDRWVLWETPQANARRAELATLVREAYEGAPEPERSQPNEREMAIDLAWGAILATPSLRVLATGDEDEALRLMRTLHAAGQLHRSLFDLGGRLPQDCTIYLLRDDTEKATFLASHPAVTDEIRAALARLDGSGVPGTSDLAYWAENEERRLDGIVRMILGHMFQVYGITLEQHPWIHEGFGLYLTDALIGTRLSWFVDPRAAAVDGNASLRDDLLRSADWMESAREVLRGEHLPRTQTLVTKSAADFTTAELLYAYVLAGYLLETRPEETPEIVRRIGAGRPSAAVLEEVLAIGCGTLDERVRRWVLERPPAVR